MKIIQRIGGEIQFRISRKGKSCELEEHKDSYGRSGFSKKKNSFWGLFLL